MRDFGTGATRNDDTTKYDYRGFLSMPALRRFAAYMHAHRVQKDGTIRASDNWKKGISREAYVSSLLRHVVDIATLYEGGTAKNPDTGEPVDLEEALSAAFFNVQGLLHEVLLGRDVGDVGAVLTDDELLDQSDRPLPVVDGRPMRIPEALLRRDVKTPDDFPFLTGLRPLPPLAARDRRLCSCGSPIDEHQCIDVPTDEHPHA